MLRSSVFYVILLANLASFSQTALLQAQTLRYNVKWPSGLSLGEASYFSSPGNASFNLDASLPGYTIQDRYNSHFSAQSCTIEFTRRALHGSHKIDERNAVSPEGKITRETSGNGGITELPFTPCPRDPLALIQALRISFAQPVQSVLFGQLYPVRFEAPTPSSIDWNEKPTPVDLVVCILTLPKSGDCRIELFFLKDTAHTLAVIRAPFALGTFSMELVR